MALVMLVKGTRHEAIQAALAHGFVSDDPWEVIDARDDGNVFFDSVQIDPTLTGEDEVERANAWMTEPASAPYPAGTLLFWR